jgi:hypothetical protein
MALAKETATVPMVSPNSANHYKSSDPFMLNRVRFYILFFTLSTTWRTSPKHHFPIGFFIPQWQFPNFFSVWIFSIMLDLPLSL